MTDRVCAPHVPLQLRKLPTISDTRSACECAARVATATSAPSFCEPRSQLLPSARPSRAPEPSFVVEHDAPSFSTRSSTLVRLSSSRRRTARPRAWGASRGRCPWRPLPRRSPYSRRRRSAAGARRRLCTQIEPSMPARHRANHGRRKRRCRIGTSPSPRAALSTREAFSAITSGSRPARRAAAATRSRRRLGALVLIDHAVMLRSWSTYEPASFTTNVPGGEKPVPARLRRAAHAGEPDVHEVLAVQRDEPLHRSPERAPRVAVAPAHRLAWNGMAPHTSASTLPRSSCAGLPFLDAPADHVATGLSCSA